MPMPIDLSKLTYAELSSRIAEARAKAANCRREMSEIHERSGPAPLSAGDQQRWENLERGAHAATLEAESTVAHYEQRLGQAADAGNVLPGTSLTGSPAFHRGQDPWADAGRLNQAGPQDDDQVRSTALRAIERSGITGDALDVAAALVNHDTAAARWAHVTSNPAYLTAFQKVWNDPTRGHLTWTDPERVAHADVVALQRAMSLTDTAGGFMVPFTLDPAIMLTSAGSANPMRQVARVVQTVTNSWNGVSSAGVTAAWYAEAAQVADNTPTLAGPGVPVHRGSAFIPFSIEIELDAAAFADECAMLLADAKDQLEAIAFVSGTGSGQPTGFVKALDGTTSEVAPVTLETFAVGDVYKLQESLPPRFQAGASWQANLAIINKMRQFATGTGQQHAFVADLTAGQPPQILGRPLHENSNMDGTFDPAATADNFVLAYGDFRNYVIADRIGTTIELVPHLVGPNGRPTGERGYFMYFRTGADVVVHNAFRLLNIATTA